MRKGHNNQANRRIWPVGPLSAEAAAELSACCVYVGSAHHKLKPGNYGLTPQRAPRPGKSVCDRVRSVQLEEAKALLKAGIAKGTVSKFDANLVPKYIWAVAADGLVFEAKAKPPREAEYHGYCLEKGRGTEADERVRNNVLLAWRERGGNADVTV